QQTCSRTQPCAQANQTCVRECPPPRPQGVCFDTITGQCTGQSCALDGSCAGANEICTLQCPRPPQCTSVPCGGPCALSPPCPSSGACPKIVLVGECALDANGSCACVQPSPQPTRTPRSTPTPQCNSVPCGGACLISSPPLACPPGVPCNGT